MATISFFDDAKSNVSAPFPSRSAEINLGTFSIRTSSARLSTYAETVFAVGKSVLTFMGRCAAESRMLKEENKF